MSFYRKKPVVIEARQFCSVQTYEPDSGGES